MKILIRKFALPVVYFGVEAVFDYFYSQLHWQQSGIVLQVEQNLAVLLSVKALGIALAFLSTHTALSELARRHAPRLRCLIGGAMLCAVFFCVEVNMPDPLVAQELLESPKKIARKRRKPTL